MPNIVKGYGVKLTGDVVRIGDAAFTPPPKRPVDDEADVTIIGADGPVQAQDMDEAAGAQELDGGFAPEEFAEAGQPDVVPAAGSGGVKREIIQSAMAEAGKILEQAVRDAEEAKSTMLADAQRELGMLRENAAVEGRKEGLASGAGDVGALAGQIDEAISHFEAGRAAFEAEYESNLKWMAMEIVQKVLAKKINQNDVEFAEMVDKAVQGVRNEPWVRVEVSREMGGLIDRLQEIYRAHENIEVNASSAPAGTVMLETPSGVVDASVMTQLDNLRDYFMRQSEQQAQQ